MPGLSCCSIFLASMLLASWLAVPSTEEWQHDERVRGIAGSLADLLALGQVFLCFGDIAGLYIITLTLFQLVLTLVDLGQQDEGNRQMVTLTELLIERDRSLGC